MAAIKIGKYHTLNSDDVSSAWIEERYSGAILHVAMKNGQHHTARHSGACFDGVDVYALHRQITAVLDGKPD